MRSSRVRSRQLVAYGAGELSGREAAEVEAHLARHREAAGTVARYRLVQDTLLADDGVDPPAATVARAKTILVPTLAPVQPPRQAGEVVRTIGRLIFDSRAQPALAGLRGQATSFQLTYELPGVPGAQLDLQGEVAEGPGDQPLWRLVGQIASRKPIPSLRVGLCRPGSSEPVHTAHGDERGVFVLHPGPGSYDLYLHLPDSVAVIGDIRVS